MMGERNIRVVDDRLQNLTIDFRKVMVITLYNNNDDNNRTTIY